MEVLSTQDEQPTTTATTMPFDDTDTPLTSEIEVFLQQEGLSRPPEIISQLEATWSAVVVWLTSLEKREKEVQEQYCTHLVIDIVSLLPKAESVSADQLCMPSKQDLFEHDTHVKTHLAAAGEKRRLADRAEALQLVIDSILVAWRAYADRIQWVMDHAAQQQQEGIDVKQALDFMCTFYATEVLRCQANVAAREVFFRNTQSESAKHVLKISERVSASEFVRRDNGYNKSEAEYLAFRDLMESKDTQVQELRKTQNEFEELIELRKEELARTENELAAFQGLQCVLQLVERHRRQSLQTAAENVQGLLEKATEAASAVVTQHLPTLMCALKTAFECHSKRQQKAEEELEEALSMLDQHLDLFGMSTPNKRHRVNEGK